MRNFREPKIVRVRRKSVARDFNFEVGEELARVDRQLPQYGRATRQPDKAFGSIRNHYEIYPGE